MPVHRCDFNALEDVVADIEASGERVVSVATANDSACVIITYNPNKRTAPKGVERR